MFKRIDHVELVTDRPADTIKFYTKVLGFKLRSQERIERPVGPSLDIAYLELGGTSVEIITISGIEVGPAPTGAHLGYNLLALEVDDMDAALAYLKSRGIDAVWGPRVLEDRYARAEVTDPNGYHIELRQWFEPRGRG